jgi:cell wall-associated NlpC family hydrolase
VNAKTVSFVAVGAVAAMLILLVVVLLPAISDEECADVATATSLPVYGTTAPRAAASTRPAVAEAAATSGAAAVQPAAVARSNSRSQPIPAGSFAISDVFGARGGTHMGVDMAAPAGTHIHAAADGRVVAAGPASGFGNWIVIDSIDERGKPYSTVYGHMYASGVHVRTGDTVRSGQYIADVGSDGQSSGPHLHFELVPGGRLTGGHQVDPVPWLAGAATPTDSDGANPYSDNPNCVRGFGSAGGNLAGGKVPPELEKWYRQAGSLCPQISSSLLAAQGRQESGFRRGLTSSSGAQGLAQFLPGTAAAADPDDGKPYVIDADHNGIASVWDDGDAIVGQGRYMCALAKKIDGWKAAGKVKGDTAELALAGYNAGEGAVLASGGMPNQYAAHFSQTQPYVKNIIAMEAGFRESGSFGRFTPGSGGNAQVVQAAQQWLGTPYVYGGGGPQGPSNGGLDCSGLTSASVFAATGGKVTLPRTSEQQWTVGTEIPLSQAQPGDLVFGNWSNGQPGHVGIYVGGGRMIHAPQTGDVVRNAPLMDGMRARRVM